MFIIYTTEEGGKFYATRIISKDEFELAKKEERITLSEEHYVIPSVIFLVEELDHWDFVLNGKRY